MLLLMTAFFGLHKYIEERIDLTIGVWLNSYFDNSNWFRALIGLSLLWIVGLSLRHQRSCIWGNLCLVGIWCYYRFANDHWTFVEFCSPIAYFDLLLLPIVMWALNWFLMRPKPNAMWQNIQIQSNSFLCKIHTLTAHLSKKAKGAQDDKLNLAADSTDNPIANENEDKLNRISFVKAFAQNLIDNIKNGVCKHAAYSISINAAWGEGKTSFMNLVRNRIQNEMMADCPVEFIDFEPWMYPSNIVSEFFVLLQQKVHPTNSKLSNAIMRYASVLEGTEASLISKLLVAYHSRKTIRDQFDEIRDGLSLINKTYIVVIDDMDRLTGPEILEVFRLIRSSANFPNLVFIFLCDKQYIVTALTDLGKQYTYAFSDKFVNTEYYLPSYNKDCLMDMAKRLAKDFISQLCTPNDYEQFEEWITDSSNVICDKSIPEMLLKNPRDVKKWIKSMALHYQYLSADVDIIDFAELELLKFKFQPIYNALRDQSEVYLYSSRDGIILWHKDMDLKPFEELATGNKLSLYEADCFTSLTKDEQEIVKILLRDLFGTWRISRTKAINKPLYFSRYFNNQLQEDEISETDYRMFITSEDFDTIKLYIDTHKAKWKSIVISLYNDRTPAPEPELIVTNKIRTIFYGSNLDDWIEPNRVYNLLMQLPENKRKGVLRNALLEKDASKWSLWFLYQLYDGVSYCQQWSTILSEAECDEIIIHIFTKALNLNLGAESIYEYYEYTLHIDDKKKLKLNQEAQKLLQEYIQQHPKLMLAFFIKTVEAHKYAVTDDLQYVYPSFDFISEQFENDQRPEVVEFKDFLEQYRGNDNTPVTYQLKYLHR